MDSTTKEATPRALELLAPAKNAEIGKAAVLAGADAVYIGGAGFGARAAASNAMAEVADLCTFAHRYGAKVYMTVNTLLYDKEIEPVRKLVAEAEDCGVDALIVQDPAVLSLLQGCDLEVHASTQWNINTLEKVAYCKSVGIAQIVVPREFSLEQIRAFTSAFPEERFEVFVSGAMCVSVSGECFISEYMTNRSANRGECAQICRLPMEFYHGDELKASGHLLSMKDNLRLKEIEQLILAGASSFKIEGRLKDYDYVVNQVAAFRQQIDAVIEQYPDCYRRASLGQCQREFTPQVEKTFNRGFTSAYLQDSNDDLIEERSPKFIGEPVGRVLDIRKQGPEYVLEVQCSQALRLNNGDSFTFFNTHDCVGTTDLPSLSGFRINKAEALGFAQKRTPQKAAKAGRGGFAADQAPQKSKGAKDDSKSKGSVELKKNATCLLFVNRRVEGIERGSLLYRNVDTFFIKQIEMPKALSRKIALSACVALESDGDTLRISYSDAWERTGSASVSVHAVQEQARQQALAQGQECIAFQALKPEVMRTKLTKTGQAFLSLEESAVSFEGEISGMQIPLSAFNALRREAVEAYVARSELSHKQRRERGLLGAAEIESKVFVAPEQYPQWPEKSIDSRLVKNEVTHTFYTEQGITESTTGIKAKAVMTCRACLIKNHALCKKEGGSTSGYRLRIGKHCFSVVTDCKHCLMYLLPEEH